MFPTSRILALGFASVVIVAVLSASGGPWAAPGLIAAFGLFLATLWLAREPSDPKPAREVSEQAETLSHGQDNSYAAALDAMADPVFIVSGAEPDDLAGRRVVFANLAAQSLLRIPKEGALLLSAVRRPEVLETIDTALYGVASASVTFETGGAQNRFWRVRASPLASSPGQSLGLVEMRDETDARRNERMRADFMANASHELRTPLASLTGFIETLRGHAREDENARDRFLSIMAVQADRMSRLIDDLMSLTRIESNEHIRPQGRCDLSLAVNDVVDAVAMMALEKKVTFALDLPPRDLAVALGDRDQILQVIQNLIDNALKYTPIGGEVVVRVRSGLKLEAAAASDVHSPRLAALEGGRLSLVSPDHTADEIFHRIEVGDSGPGMERRHLPRLSERFYRVEGQKSGEKSGTGLGLAIVKHIVNRHRGGLWVETAPSAGSVFAVYFPAAPAKADASPVTVTKAS